VYVAVRLVHRQSREFPARGSRRGYQRLQRVPVRTWSKFHGHGSKLENGKYAEKRITLKYPNTYNYKTKIKKGARLVPNGSVVQLVDVEWVTVMDVLNLNSMVPML